MSEAMKMEESAFFLVPEEDPEDASLSRARMFLERCLYLDRRIGRKMAERDRMMALAAREKGSLEALPSDPSVLMDSRSVAAFRCRNLEHEIDRDTDHLCNVRGEVESVLSELEDPRLSSLLEMRYLRGRSVAEVARSSGYCRRHTNRLLREGLLRVDRILRDSRPMQGYVSSLE